MRGLKCIKCGKTASPTKLSFQGEHIDGWKCKCGEEYFDPAQAQRILSINKLKEHTIKAKLGKLKSNLLLRIPKAVEEALDLHRGDIVKIRVINSKKTEVST